MSTQKGLPNGGESWDSGRVASLESVGRPFGGRRLLPRTRYFWRVRIWDEIGSVSAWSKEATFETGLLETPWRAEWIGLRHATDSDAPPAIYLRRDFQLESRPTRARLYITARGLFQPWINGTRVGADCLVPGWTDYRRRIDVLIYDVTSLLLAGHNVLGAILGDGWWSGFLSEQRFKLRYGEAPSLSAKLFVEARDGKETVVSTDGGWLARDDGPIQSNALYHGETYDARRETVGWFDPGTPGDGWKKPAIFHHPAVELRAKVCPPVRIMENREPVAITEPQPGVSIFDLGENIVGWARLCLTAPHGTKVRLRFGEMLEADGTLHTANLRSARATDVYICRGDECESWEPRFTYHGFRYVEVSGLPGKPKPDTIVGRVIYSDRPETGSFECSDPLINRLQACIVRSQKGNFVDLPTDCPQRDERLGWSGDAQVFAPTACYNLESGPIFRSWMRAMCDGQREDGAFPDLAPHILLEHGNAGWGDAGIIVPWTVWQWSGDRRILEENYPAMVRHMEFQRRTSRRLIRPETLFGDWLSLDPERNGKPATPKDLIGTAYFARTAQLLSKIAAALEKRREANKWAALFEKIRAAFQREFVAANGFVDGDTQTSYLLALGFDLLPESLRVAATGRLVELLEVRDWRLSTGFLGTPLLCPVLSACGQSDVAYRLLQQRSFPSWLYPVLNGATTMWERWDSWTKESGFSKSGMNSFNHYAYGAIGEWLYGNVAGLTPAAPGFRRLRIAPEPGGGLSWARAKVQTPYGSASSSWRITRGSFSLNVVVPPNTSAEVRLPAPRLADATESRRSLARGNGILEVREAPDAVIVLVGSGKYCFRCPAPA